MAEVKTSVSNTGNASGKSGNTMMVNMIIVAGCIALAHILFYTVFRSESNFLDGATRHKAKNLFGTMYQGGWVVPILISTFFIMLCFVVERFLTIFKSRGKVSNAEFIKKVQYHLSTKNIDAALAECDKQSGSVGNVMKAGLKKYKEMTTSNMDTDMKVANIKKEIEESTALELPMLEKNLVFLSTITSAATLLGLFGTVMGMIRAFSAMSAAGAPDAGALAAGISEALVNTLVGILTSALAIIFYNYFSNRIDQITYSMDEAGMSIIQEFQSSGK